MPLFHDQVQRQKMNEDQLFTALQQQTTQQTRTVQQGGPQQPGAQQQQNPVQQIRSYSSLSKDEKKAEKEKHKAVIAQNTFITQRDLENTYMQHRLQDTVKVDGHKITQAQLYDAVVNGDYTHMEKLDGVLRNKAATEYLRDHRITGEPEDFIRSLKSHTDPVKEMLNPMLRLSISLVLHSPDVDDAVKEKYRKLDELLNTEIMVATLTKKVDASEGFSPDEMARNIASQVFITKMLLSCHIGKFIKKDSTKNPPHSWWTGSIANAFAHCSRVVVTMPGQTGAYDEEKEKKMLGHFYGGAGFYGRMSATHTLYRKRRDGSADAKEDKIKVNPLNQYGMNVAVGGMGNNGIPDAHNTDRKLKNDGSCGHLYMHLEKGNETKHSGMLFGFESDSVGTVNQMGHTHDMFATPEFASSFGGQRCDEIGDKYGGREADLSEVNIDAYTDAMSLCDEAMNAILSGAFQDHGELKEIAELVSGGPMAEEDLMVVFTNLYSISNAVNHVAGQDPYNQATTLYGRLGIHK